MVQKVFMCCLGLCLSMMSVAQTPTDAVSKYLQDYQALGIQSVAIHLHSAELEKIKTEILPFLDVKKTPQAVRLRHELFGDNVSYSSLVSDRASTFVTKLFTQMGKDAMVSGLALDKFEVLGEVVEGADVHVLTRSSFSYSSIKLTQLDVITTRKDNGQWRILPPKEAASITRTIQSIIKSYSP